MFIFGQKFVWRHHDFDKIIRACPEHCPYEILHRIADMGQFPVDDDRFRVGFQEDIIGLVIAMDDYWTLDREQLVSSH